jgi:hypothetical protein
LPTDIAGLPLDYEAPRHDSFTLNQALKKKTGNIISGEFYYDYFKTSFSPIVLEINEEKSKDNCKTILFSILKDSINSTAYDRYITGYITGNPLWNDVRYGCILFFINDTRAFIDISHPCGNSTLNCCKCVIKEKHTPPR